ncbi:SIMPL domain-containing protein [Alkalicoccus urumqiensis]|uniref:SIMPL domain-containing protein n=1 Tax=Alkalicoccus urumqiensis TaxID=1548213 RepID=A0A2P6MLH3_ALKUR|nr:SIMPL domain-containing protein [Alkalicoccus urumqiensis]PRO67110.1 hypothetical protein C6I21_00650 [Alkalicoccus urumqiensis]
MMKRLGMLGGAAAVAAAVLFLLQAVLPGGESPETNAGAAEEIQAGTLVVEETGEISVTPDVATVHLGARITAETADEAQADVNERMEAVRSALDDYDIPEEDIQTQNVNVMPITNHQSGAEEYQASHQLTVDYRDLDRVGELIDAVSEAGANHITHTQFGLENDEEAEKEALDQAIQNASVRADAMAEAAGRGRGEILQISDSQAQVSLPVQEDMAQEESADAAGTEVNAGEITVTQNITIVYELQ